MLTVKRRNTLLERAKDYEAVVVMCCEAAVATVRSTLESISCHVIPGMRFEGILSIQPEFSLPCSISLGLESVTPYVHPDARA